jgi:hypothetical protein
VSAGDFAAVVKSIHRTYDERKLAEESQFASTEAGLEQYEN